MTIAPLDERAMSHPFAPLIIEEIARRCTNLSKTDASHLERKFNRRSKEYNCATAVRALDFAGYITRQTGEIRLTRKGWQQSGMQIPIWLEETK